MTELSRRERERLSRRNEILKAAWEVFASKDYASATIDEIAEAAELSKGTVYLYFRSKADLFLSTFEMGVKRVNSIVQQAVSSSDDPVIGLKEIIKRLLDFVEESADFFKILASEQTHFRIHAEGNPDFKKRMKSLLNYEATNPIEDHIKHGISMGVFRQVNPRDAAIVLVEVVRGLAFRRIMDPTTPKLPDRAESVAGILLYGLKMSDE